MLPLRVVGWRLYFVLSSQWICEDVLSVDFPQAFSLVSRFCTGLCRLCGFFRWSGFWGKDNLLVNQSCRSTVVLFLQMYQKKTPLQWSRQLLPASPSFSAVWGTAVTPSASQPTTVMPPSTLSPPVELVLVAEELPSPTGPTSEFGGTSSPAG